MRIHTCFNIILILNSNEYLFDTFREKYHIFMKGLKMNFMRNLLEKKLIIRIKQFFFNSEYISSTTFINLLNLTRINKKSGFEVGATCVHYCYFVILIIYTNRI